MDDKKEIQKEVQRPYRSLKISRLDHIRTLGAIKSNGAIDATVTKLAQRALGIPAEKQVKQSIVIAILSVYIGMTLE